MTRRFWAGLAIVAASILAVAVIGYLLLRPTPPPRLTLRSASFDQLSGWRDDAQAAALPAFRRSCAAFLAQPADAPLDPRNKSTRFGSPADWRRACDAAAAVPQGDNNAAREFFETNFTPFLAGNGESSEGLFTGYFEMSLNGSRQRSGRYQTPLYRRPPEPDRTKYRRDEIEDGALAGRGLELLWVDDPVDAFFLEIQGSGRVRLPDGNVVRIGYDGANGKPYVVIGRLLVERGELPREQVTMAAIRGWMRAHPKEAAALRRENPSFVFFREIPGDGPLGAEQIVLTAGRSLAVDRRFVPLGVPLWLDARQRYGSDEIRRLVVAQDTGGAIKGPVRGDLFWGHGKAAAHGAGAMNATGRYYLLLPREVAAKITPDE